MKSYAQSKTTCEVKLKWFLINVIFCKSVQYCKAQNSSLTLRCYESELTDGDQRVWESEAGAAVALPYHNNPSQIITDCLNAQPNRCFRFTFPVLISKDGIARWTQVRRIFIPYYLNNIELQVYQLTNFKVCFAIICMPYFFNVKPNYPGNQNLKKFLNN